MPKIVFYLFPGQGAQYPAMALDFLESGRCVKSLFSIASEVYGNDIENILRGSSAEELKKTDVSQITITLANLCAAAFLEEKGIKPAGCAGFSLGEYAALAVSGVLSAEDCLRLVAERGKAMQKAIDKIAASCGNSADSAPGMAAVVGLDSSVTQSLVTQYREEGLSLYAANINSPRQLVISGSADALKEAELRLKKAGARRVLRLQVAGPFHCPLMKEAAQEFGEYVKGFTFNDPAIPVFSNVTGMEIKSGCEAKGLVLRQITEPVRWIDEETAIDKLKPDVLLETGPGKVLQGLWKDSGSSVPCLPAGTVSDIDAFLASN